MRTIGLIWAQTPDGVIGANNTIPWRIPEDMAHFKALTLGHPVVMGRKTWDSLPPRFRPLTDRRNIVISRDASWSAEGAEHAGSLNEALEMTTPSDTWIIGGGEIYRAAMDYATTLLITEVDLTVDGDAFAPALNEQWTLATDEPWQQSEPSGTRYRFRTYTRR